MPSHWQRRAVVAAWQLLEANFMRSNIKEHILHKFCNLRLPQLRWGWKRLCWFTKGLKPSSVQALYHKKGPWIFGHFCMSTSNMWVPLLWLTGAPYLSPHPNSVYLQQELVFPSMWCCRNCLHQCSHPVVRSGELCLGTWSTPRWDVGPPWLRLRYPECATFVLCKSLFNVIECVPWEHAHLRDWTMLGPGRSEKFASSICLIPSLHPAVLRKLDDDIVPLPCSKV